MREHKYRGKRMSNGEWVYGNLIYNYDPHQKENVIIEWYIREPLRNIGSVWQVDPETVGQFTGLKDKEGNDIYEGDIVYDSDSEGKAVIEWGTYDYGKDTWDLRPACIGFITRYSDGTINGLNDLHDSYGFRSHESEVIGNIHDNPDLIK